MRRKRQFAIGVEVCDARLLLSGGLVVADPGVATLSLGQVAPLHSVSKGAELQAKGRYVAPSHLMIPDAGESIRFLGTSNLQGIGKVTVAGSLNGVGFIQSGFASGDIFIISSKGRMKLTLVGPSQTGFSPIPNTFQFRVESATGNLSKFAGAGVATFTFKPDVNLNSAPHGRSGAFTLKLDPQGVIAV